MARLFVRVGARSAVVRAGGTLSTAAWAAPQIASARLTRSACESRPSEEPPHAASTSTTASGRLRRTVSRAGELDEELAVQRLGDPQEGVDPGRAATALEPGDGGLRRAGQLGE